MLDTLALLYTEALIWVFWELSLLGEDYASYLEVMDLLLEISQASQAIHAKNGFNTVN